MPIDDFESQMIVEYVDPPELVINYDGMFGEIFKEIFGRSTVENKQ